MAGELDRIAVDRDAADAMARAGAIAVPTLVTYEALATEGARLGLPAESAAKVSAVRDAIGPELALGVRLCGDLARLYDELLDGG